MDLAEPSIGPDLARLIDSQADPYLVLDADGRCIHSNAAANGLIDGDARRWSGSSSPFAEGRSYPTTTGRRRTRLGWTEVEFTAMPLPESGLEVVRFVPVHQRSRRDRQLAAFVAIATSLAEVDNLEVILNNLAREVRSAAELESCAVTLLDQDDHVRTAGTAGLPDNYAALLEACRRRGAPLLTVRALQQDHVIVDAAWRGETLDDPRWEPLHDTIRALELGILIAAPLTVQSPTGGDRRVRGALTAFRREGNSPDDEDITFLAAMAEHAAIAISHARMFRRLRLDTVREERRKLSRELHDSVTQDLFSLSLRTKALQIGVADGSAIDVMSELGDMHDQIRGALTEMRSLILNGRASDLGDEGLVASLRARCIVLGQPSGPVITIDSPLENYDLHRETEEDIYMLVIEAVRNAIKHASASTIVVTVAPDPESPRTLVVSVVDDGTGIGSAPRSVSAVGLDAMSERARQHGGELAIDSVDGGGTRVVARFPGALAATPDSEPLWSTGSLS